MWLHTELEKLNSLQPRPEDTELQERLRKEQQEKEEAIANLRKQQQDIEAQPNKLTGESKDTTPEQDKEALLKILERPVAPSGTSQPQEPLMQQLKSILRGKKQEDPNKMLCKALITEQNKAPLGGGGPTHSSYTSCPASWVMKGNPQWWNGWLISTKGMKVSLNYTNYPMHVTGKGVVGTYKE